MSSKAFGDGKNPSNMSLLGSRKKMNMCENNLTETFSKNIWNKFL